MSDATWYLGPLGDLRALTCPEPGISTSEVRYGGVHQALSGARTMDILGHRSEYTFEWTYMEPAEWTWLRALHTRHVPGPFRLINPMRKNRLTPQASAVTPAPQTSIGVHVLNGTWDWVWDWPTEAGPGARALSLPSWGTGNAVVRFDWNKPIALFPNETVTFSAYVKADGDTNVRLVIDFFDRYGKHITSSPQQTRTVTTEWQRVSLTHSVADAEIAGAAPAILTAPQGTPGIRLAAPQFESGSAATAWEQGGAAPVVLIDQLETSSPRFPLTDCTLTLLEA